LVRVYVSVPYPLHFNTVYQHPLARRLFHFLIVKTVLRATQFVEDYLKLFKRVFIICFGLKWQSSSVPETAVFAIIIYMIFVFIKGNVVFVLNSLSTTP
jgi:hypothetical protein